MTPFAGVFLFPETFSSDSISFSGEVLPDKITDALGRGERSIEMRFTNKDAFDEAKKNLLEGDDIYFMIDRANLRNLRHFGNWVSNRHISYITDGQFYVIRVYFQ